MRYLRILTNAVICGVLGAAYLAVLVLQLNPQVPTLSITAERWFVTLVIFYGSYFSVGVFVLLLVRDLLSWRPLSPGWVSVRLLAWLGAGEAALAAVVTWANLKGFRAMLSDTVAERLREGATATTVFAAVLVTVAVLRYSFGRRGTRSNGHPAPGVDDVVGGRPVVAARAGRPPGADAPRSVTPGARDARHHGAARRHAPRHHHRARRRRPRVHS